MQSIQFIDLVFQLMPSLCTFPVDDDLDIELLDTTEHLKLTYSTRTPLPVHLRIHLRGV